jgi:PAS domain S-box-containing protein
MSHPTLPPDEAERLAALGRYNILDTLPEQAFDDLTRLAAHICRAPIAFIGFIDAHRQWFKSWVGLTIQETPRYISFCAHAILEPDVCVVPDARADERFADNPLVTAVPQIRFYAAAQLVTPEGHAIGTLCVVDHAPRELSADEVDALRILARQVMAQVELRRQAAEAEHTIAENERVHEEIRFQASLLDAVEEAVIASDLSGEIIYCNCFTEIMYGWPRAEAIGRNVMDIIPAEISRGAGAEIMSRLSCGESWSGEFIVRRRDGSSFPAHVTDSPIYDSGGNLIGIVGISTDITRRKRAEEELRRAHEEMEGRVERRTRELAAANALLREEIAERERAEQALRESHNLMRAVIEGTTDFIYVKDLDGRYLMMNSAAATFIGRPVEEAIGKDDTELFPPETARQIIEHDRRVIAAGEALSSEGSSAVAGEPRAVKLRTLFSVKNVYRNEEGKTIGLVGISRDITERKQMEEELRASEEHFRLLVEGLRDYAIFMLDTDGRIISWNDGASRLKGYLPEEAIGQHFSICCTPEEFARGKPEEALKVAATEGRFEDECLLVRKDGSLFWANVVIRALRDEQGRLRGFAEVTRDITERKQAEDALREQREFLRQVIDVIPHALFVKDGEERFALANKAMAKVYGTTVENLISKTDTDFKLDEELVERFHRQNQEVRETGRELLIPEEPVTDVKTGEVRWFETIKVPLFAPDGTIHQVLGVGTDITERVRAREARSRLQRRLLAAQEEERRHLSRELHDQLGQHLPALMLGLKAIRSLVQSERVDGHLHQLENLAERIARDAQALARDLRPSALDDFGLQVALSNYLDEWSNRYGIAADFHSNGFAEDERLPTHLEITLYRTAQEALTNVAKHARAEHVSLILRRGREGVTTIVEDDGEGFDVGAARDIPVSDRRLGLLGMQERVEIVGGTLEVESAPGAGTTVLIRIPASSL